VSPMKSFVTASTSSSNMLDVLPDDRALTIVVLERYQVEVDNLVASCVVCDSVVGNVIW